MKKNEMTKKLMEEFNEDFIDVGGVLDTTLPDPTMVEYYRRLKKREILWNDDISDATIDIALYIKKWNAEDKGIAPEERKPIKIFINSDGGSVDTVLHIIDMIHLSKTPIYTIGMGRVYSAGGLLLMAGHKRYVFPHTSCLMLMMRGKMSTGKSVLAMHWQERTQKKSWQCTKNSSTYF